jgi:hypothetical protein
MIKEKEFPLGVWYHEKKGFAVLYKPDDQDDWADWTIDKGKWKAHPILRMMIPVVRQGSGSYFLSKELKDYEFWGEL